MAQMGIYVKPQKPHHCVVDEIQQHIETDGSVIQRVTVKLRAGFII